jgi:ribonuclease P protein component
MARGNMGSSPISVTSEHNPAAQDQSWGASHRLHSNRDYGRAFHRQQKAAGRMTVVLLSPRRNRADGRPSEARLGVMVAAKTVKTAVRRHQLKRWVRELVRTRLQSTLLGWDTVVLFRQDPPDAPDAHRRLDDEIVSLVTKALAAKPQPGSRGGGGRSGGSRGGGNRSSGNRSGGNGGSEKSGGEKSSSTNNRPQSTR